MSLTIILAETFSTARRSGSDHCEKVTFIRGSTVSRYFAILTLQALLHKDLSVYLLDTSISENIGDLKKKGCILKL